MEQESLTRSVRSPPTSTLPTTTRRLHVFGGEGEAKNRMDFLGVGSMGFVMVLFCFVLLVFLPFFSWDFSPSFTWTDTMAVSTVQPTKLMGGSISSPKKHDEWGAQTHR